MSQQPPEHVTPPPISSDSPSSDSPQFYSGPLSVPHKIRVPKTWKAMELLGGLGIVISVVITVGALLASAQVELNEDFYSFLAFAGLVAFFASCLTYAIGRGMAWWQSN